MYSVDYHSHTLCSIDSEAPLTEMMSAAVGMGMQELCTTDHYDMLTQEGDIAPRLDWTSIVAQYESAKASAPEGFALKLGIELGSAQINPQFADEVVAAAPLDLVIGSIHNGGKDFGCKDIFFMDFSQPAFCHALVDDYLTQMQRLAPLPCYDVMGHVIYPFRYMPPMGKGYFEDTYFARFRDVLNTIIASGHGIEINTTRNPDLSAWKPVLELYRSCGGEIITTGSDAHAPHQVAVGISEAQQLLRDVGFRYQTVYTGRKPSFVKL